MLLNTQQNIVLRPHTLIKPESCAYSIFLVCNHVTFCSIDLQSNNLWMIFSLQEGFELQKIKKFYGISVTNYLWARIITLQKLFLLYLSTEIPKLQTKNSCMHINFQSLPSGLFLFPITSSISLSYVTTFACYVHATFCMYVTYISATFFSNSFIEFYVLAISS